MNPKIVIINGSGTSGKDTFVKFCSVSLTLKDGINTLNISTVDKVYDIAEQLGWNRKKDEEGRQFLSDLKDIWSKYNNGPFMYTTQRITEFLNNNTNGVIFVHSREPDEIQRFVDYYKESSSVDIFTVIITNSKKYKTFSNHADTNVEEYDYDYIITNNGTLLGLYQKADDFCENLIE